jgi:hypothetical protein
LTIRSVNFLTRQKGIGTLHASTITVDRHFFLIALKASQDTGSGYGFEALKRGEFSIS